MTDPRELIRVWDNLSWLAQRDASESYTQGFRDALEQALNERDAWRNEGEGGVSAYLDAIEERDAARAEAHRLAAALRRIELWPFDVMREAHEDLAAIKEFAADTVAASARSFPCDACENREACREAERCWRSPLPAVAAPAQETKPC